MTITGRILSLHRALGAQPRSSRTSRRSQGVFDHNGSSKGLDQEDLANFCKQARCLGDFGFGQEPRKRDHETLPKEEDGGNVCRCCREMKTEHQDKKRGMVHPWVGC